MNRGELIEAVQRYTSRTDVNFDTILANTQAIIDRRVRLRKQQAFITIGAANLDTDAPTDRNRYRLPADYLAIDFIVAGGSRDQYSYQTPSANFQSESARYAFPRPASVYTIYGDYLYLSNEPTTDTTVLFGYYQQLDRLTLTTDTNLLATDHPDVYIAAMIVEVYKILQDDILQGKHEKELEMKFTTLNTTEQRGSFNLRDLTSSPPRRQVI